MTTKPVKKKRGQGNKKPELIPAERKAIQILTKNPTMGNTQISKQLVDLGLTKDEGYVRKRLTRSDFLKGEVSRIRAYNAEVLSRDIVPLALKEHKAALKDKDTSREKKFKWAKLALDKEFGTDDKRRPVSPINIKIDSLQAIITESMGIMAPGGKAD